jgi:hypothetical protein
VAASQYATNTSQVCYQPDPGQPDRMAVRCEPHLPPLSYARRAFDNPLRFASAGPTRLAIQPNARACGRCAAFPVRSPLLPALTRSLRAGLRI